MADEDHTDDSWLACTRNRGRSLAFHGGQTDGNAWPTSEESLHIQLPNVELLHQDSKNGSTSLSIDGVTCVGSNIAADPISADKIRAPSMPRAHSLVSNKMQSQDAVNPKFMWSVFFKEFFYHTFFPFSLPVILYFEGEIYSTNHQFTNIYGFIYQSWLSVVVLSSNLFYFMSLSILSSKVPNIELYLANTVFLLHRFMVSSKYGYMEPEMLDHLHSRVFSVEELADNELIGGWLSPSESLSGRELIASGTRLGFDLSKVVFHVNMSNEEISDFLATPSYNCAVAQSVQNRRTICLKGTLLRIILEVTAQNTTWAQNFIRCLALILAFMAPVIRQLTGESQFQSAVGFLFSAGCIFTTYFFYHTEVMFVYVGIMDYLRHAQLLAAMAVLIDPTELSPALKDDLMYKYIPKNMAWVDLSIKENIVSWFVARQVIQNFGLHYRKRISLYTTLTSLLVAVLLLMLLSQTVFQQVGVTATNSSIIIAMAFYNLAVLLTCISLMIFFGSRANDSYWIHRGTLGRIQMSYIHLMAIRERMADLDGDFRENTRSLSISRDKLKDSDLLIDSAKELLEVDNQIAPVTILGVRASVALISSLFTLSGSVVTFALQSYKSK